jgi:hypothetical protein
VHTTSRHKATIHSFMTAPPYGAWPLV